MVINIDMNDQTADTLSTYLSGQGLKLTQQRKAILKVLSEAGCHLSVEELFLRVKKETPGIGYATVYRTVRLLADAGLAHERRFEGGLSRYEHAPGGRHHDHLICTVCGTILEFENEQIEKLQQAVADRHRFQVTNHKLELYGICAACRKRRR